MSNLKDGYKQAIRNGNTVEEKKIAVTIEGIASGSFGSLLQGVVFNYIGATYPLPTREVYTYRDGGAGGTITAVVEVNYTNSTKDVLNSVERTI